ncbi:MAG: septal ring lytic transglycosylase RlpA family protein [Rhodospirillaceae bacterium]
MNTFQRGLRPALIGMALGLAGCAGGNPPVTAPAPLPRSDAAALPDSGTYKVGNPYEIAGTWYYPSEDYTYIEEGIASWYGQDFHGKRTANGERYDMNAISAAHPTLPLPSIVKVTNLDNGRVLEVRVNDRGPFHSKRIIDLSRRGAQLLGFYEAGTARVRVEIDAQQSMDLKNVALKRNPGEMPQVAAVPRATVSASALPPPAAVRGEIKTVAAAPAKPPQAKAPAPGAPPKPAVAIPANGPATSLFIQAGAFSQISNAQRLEQQLKELGIGSVLVLPVASGEKQVFRVRMGPLVDQSQAETLLTRVKSYGYDDAQIVRD